MLDPRSYLVVAGVLAMALAGLALWNPRLPRPGGGKTKQLADEARRANAAIQKARRLRMARLASDPDPERRKYAPLVERGESWPDDQIAYNQDPRMTASCPHLQPVESAIRAVGIPARLLTEAWRPGSPLYSKVRANCRLNRADMARQFGLLDSLTYSEGYAPERYQYDNPWAELTCAGCRSVIELVHPEWPQENTRWFPSVNTAERD